MSFFFLLLYIVATFFRPQDWMAGFYGKPVIDILAGCVFFFLVFERFGGRGKHSGFVRVSQGRLMVGFFACILMSHIVHTYFAGLTNAFLMFLPTFVLFFLLLNGVNTSRKFKVTIWLIILLIVILVPQGIYQLEHGYGWAGQPVTMQHGGGRIIERINWIGIFNDPNDLALTFVIAIGFLLPFVFGKCSVLLRIASLGGMATLLYGLILTNSRGGILALLATGFFFFVRKTKKFVLGGIVGGVMGFLFLMIAPSRMSELSSAEASASSRLDLWYEGLQIFKHNLVFGRGYSMFMEDLSQTAHNSYVLAAAELGTVGLIFWVGLLFISIKGCWIVQEKDKDLATYALAIQSGIVGFAAAAFFLSRTYNILPFLLVALSGSLLHIAQQKDQTIKCSVTKKDWRNIIFISVLSIVSVYIFIRAR